MAIIERSKLLEAVTWAGKVAATMPRGVGQNIHLACSEGCLTVRALGGEGSFSVRMPCEGEPWEAWLGAQASAKVLRSIKGTEVEVEGADNGVTVKWGKRKVRVGAPGSESLDPIPVFELPPKWQIQIWGHYLARLLSRVNVTVSSDATREHLSGVALLPGPDGLGAVSTDGHRLHKASESATCDDGDGRAVWALLPGFAGRLLEHVTTRLVKAKWDSTGGAVLVGLDDGWLTVKIAIQDDSEVTYRVRVIDSRFPPYEKVIPYGHSTMVRMDLVRFVEAVKLAGDLSPGTNSGIKLGVNGNGLAVLVDDSETGVDLEEHVEGEVTGDIPVDHYGFNAGYLLDALRRMGSSEVTAKLCDSLDPLVLEVVDGEPGERFLAVVMPLRL
ncbi:MAG TPA: DNA polymerase III subunit beta [Anaerolineae bacterium]|nr:DNA polymerase III subunit beta [Anaerolineae bacterium]